MLSYKLDKQEWSKWSSLGENEKQQTYLSYKTYLLWAKFLCWAKIQVSSNLEFCNCKRPIYSKMQ